MSPCTSLTGVSLQMCYLIEGCPQPNQYVELQNFTCQEYPNIASKVTAMLGNQAYVDAGNTAWMLGSSALVMIMTPGVGLFYAGLAGETSAANTLLMSFACMCIVSFQWWLFGYGFAFGPGTSGFGSFDYAAFVNLNGNPSAVYGYAIPHLLWAIFQNMFAMITPALISGALIGRMKFSSFCIFVFIWTTFIYDPLAHWFWSLTLDDTYVNVIGLGWLNAMGAIDFAGGNVIHISSGFASLAAALVLGKRYNHGEPIKPHNIPMTMLGAALLWFGWFGFNAGSAGGTGNPGGVPNIPGSSVGNNLATQAFFNTQLATATAGITWILVEKAVGLPMSGAGMASGIVAGLVAITPACGFIDTYAAFLVGLFVSPACFAALKLKGKCGIDDTLDSFAIHGIGGIVGASMAGLFASDAVNLQNGGFYGDGQRFGVELLGILVASSFSFFGTVVIMLCLKFTIGIRIDEEKERGGIDLSEHGGKSYLNRVS